MPCYNASAFLREAVDSVVSQTYADWELLIIDDGSTDNSKQIAKEYVAKDKRIQLIEQSNSGACRARNNGIEHAHGEYVKFLDADDILEHDCLSAQVQQIAMLQDYQIPFGDYYNIDKNRNILSSYLFNRQSELTQDAVNFFFNEWRVLISSPLHRAELLRKIGGFDEELLRGQESDLHLRLALADVEFIYFPMITFRYRDHNAISRISENFKEGTPTLRAYRIQRAHKCEKLFLEKYSKVPPQYHRYFADVWFSCARNCFSEGKTKEGHEYLTKAKDYGLQTCFQKSYCIFGTIFGYIPVEKILHLRLKLLHKA